MNSRTATIATQLQALPARGLVASVALLTVVVVLITTLTGAG
jgi:hypothetical protein